jgi:hypothetical protein
VQRLRATVDRHRDDGLEVEIGADRDRVARLPHMRGVPVDVGEDHDGADAEPVQGADHPAGDLAPVGDQDGVEHLRRRVV